MKNLLLTSLVILGACGPTTIYEDTGDIPKPPVTSCDYNEWDLGLTDELGLAQYITSLPVYHDYVICGNLNNVVDTALQLDYDSFLFPITGNFGETHFTNIVLQTGHSHTPLVELFLVVDGLEPLKLSHFIGVKGIVQVIDWPVLLQGQYQNDLLVRISGYSFATELDSEYEMRFW